MIAMLGLTDNLSALGHSLDHVMKFYALLVSKWWTILNHFLPECIFYVRRIVSDENFSHMNAT